MKFGTKKQEEPLPGTGYTHLAKGTIIKGILSSKDALRIEGSIEGDIDCLGKVIIAESGTIAGDLSCYEAELYGSVEGDIFSKGITRLRSTCSIDGDIHTTSLEVESGASIRGQLTTGK